MPLEVFEWGEFVLVLSEAVLVLDVFRLFAFALKAEKPEYEYEHRPAA